MTYGSTFTTWRAGAPDAWQAYGHHEFVKGLGDGILPREAFLHYLIQDYVFLIHFSRAWALALVKSETVEEMRVCAGTVDALVNHEMKLHVETCAAAGIDEQTLYAAAEEEDANLAYTRFVMDTGLQGDFLDMMAALAPCVFGYGEIGARLAKSRTPDATYGDWIDAYASEEYQRLCHIVGGMIDAAVERRMGSLEPSPRAVQLQAKFTKATELEVKFWDMGLRPST